MLESHANIYIFAANFTLNKLYT